MENKKRRGIRPGDIIVLVVLAALVAGAVWVARGGEAVAHTATVRYTVELGQRTRVAAGFHEHVALGDAVFDGVRGNFIGTVVDVYVLPFDIAAFDETTGQMANSPIAEQERVYIVIETYAAVSAYEISADGFHIAVGRPVYVRAASFAGDGFIVVVDAG